MTQNPSQSTPKATAPQIVVARRHVAEFEQRVERQKRLIEELERDKHLNMLDDANKVLETMEHSLRLAREHLQLEIAHHGSATRS